MTMRRCVLILCFGLALAAAGVAQPHPGGVMMGTGYPENNLSYLNGLFVAGKDGTFTTLVDTYTATRPDWFLDVQMGIDNESVVFGCKGSSSSLYNLTYGIFRCDPKSGKYTTLARDTKDFKQVYGLVATQDGAWHVCSQATDAKNQTTYHIYEVSNTGGWSTILTTVELGHKQQWIYPVGRDCTSGDLLIPSSGTVGFFTRPVYALATDGTVSTWNMSSSGPQPQYGWTQEIASGDMLYLNRNTLYRTPPGRLPMTSKAVKGFSGVYTYGLVYENQSTAKPALITYGARQLTTLTEASLFWIDPQLSEVTQTKTFLQANAKIAVPYGTADIKHHQTRYIQTVKTAAGKWDLRLSFPAYPKKGYVLAAGLSGVRPGLLFPDGRHVWLNFDDLVPLVVDNKIPFVINPGPLVLDANGRATGKINMSWAELPLGVTVHFLVAVLDPAAPMGVALITEPYPLQL